MPQMGQRSADGAAGRSALRPCCGCRGGGALEGLLVDVLHGAPRRRVPPRRQRRPARIGEQDVQAAPLFDRGVDDALDVGLVQHVGLDEDGAAGGLAGGCGPG